MLAADGVELVPLFSAQLVDADASDAIEVLVRSTPLDRVAHGLEHHVPPHPEAPSSGSDARAPIVAKSALAAVGANTPAAFALAQPRVDRQRRTGAHQFDCSKDEAGLRTVQGTTSSARRRRAAARSASATP